MAAPSSKTTYSGLARRLVLDGLLDEQSARSAAQEAANSRTPFVTHLVSKKVLKAIDIAHAASQDFGVPLVDLNVYDKECVPKGLVKEALIRKHHAIPIFQRGNRLYIAMSDPTNLSALDEIKFHTGINTYSILVEEDKLQKFIEDVLNVEEETSFDDLDDEDLDDIDLEAGEEEQEDVDSDKANDAPIVRFVNKILLDALNRNASDIHFEPYEKSFRVRYRIDGILYEVAAPPTNLAIKITARIKVMSKLDISERRVPQDGQMKMRLSKNRSIDFRVNTCPVVYGEKTVLRILDASNSQVGIEALGYEKDQEEMFLAAIHKAQGMVLVTGPTGSGKTVSLYTGLNILNTTEKNISTAEDPVELPVAGVNQVNINTKTGLDFPAALKAFLRQDPDIIMVGEIRDLDTASIAVKAAQTGHLVLSTLHTNSAPETLTRLSNMGVPLFNIATSVILIIAQRLLRRLCNECKQPVEIPDTTLKQEGFTDEQIKDMTVYEPKGCEHCTNGYKGRVGIYEVLQMSEGIGRIIMEGGNSIEIADYAKTEGFRDLRQSALRKVVEGLSSLEEANRITK